MSYFAKKRLSYYKEYKSDIWGIVRNNLQFKWDRTNYNINNIFLEARKASRQAVFPKRFYKWNTFIVMNTVLGERKRHWKYVNFIHENSIKCILYYYLLFYFFKSKITSRLYHTYKVFFFYKRKFFSKKFYHVPYIYEPRIYNVVHRKIKKGAEYLSLQLMRLFYIIYTYKHLKNLIRKSKKSINSFENKFILLIECKLPSFIYIISIFGNMFESIDFIKGNNLFINKIMVNNLYYTIKLMDFVSFDIYLKGYIFWVFFKRLRRKAFLFIFPKYMYISLIFFFIILIRFPNKKDIINPVTIDMYRASHYI